MLNVMLKPVLALGLLLAAVSILAAPSPRDVTFPTADGGRVDADLYGQGQRAVVFAHGAIFNKQSWAGLAKRFAAEGYRALAIDFRGYGKSQAGKDPGALDQDVLAAVHWLHAQGAQSVSVVGGSMGGGAAGKAATEVGRGDIDKLVLLSAMPVAHPENLHANAILFIASRNEGLVGTVREQYAQAPEPKQLVLLPGRAHAQNIFATSQAQRLSDEILHFVTGSH